LARPTRRTLDPFLTAKKNPRVNLIAPKTDILPPAQRLLWPALRILEHGFVLYGGTAVALRYGHRQSIDFDFFAAQAFDPDILKAKYEFLKKGETIQLGLNTLSLLVPTPYGEVKFSFFGGLTFGRVGHPAICVDNLVRVASPLDLAIQKLKVIRVRSEAKDYLDLDCLLRNGVDLAEALGGAQTLYPGFPIPVTLRAMCYFDDGDVGSIPNEAKKRLMAETRQFNAPAKVPLRDDHLDLSPSEIKRVEKKHLQLKKTENEEKSGKKPKRKTRPNASSS